MNREPHENVGKWGIRNVKWATCNQSTLPKWPRYPSLVAKITIEGLIGNRDLLNIHFVDS